MTDESPRPTQPPPPEKGVPTKEKPDMGVKRDFKNPEQPDEEKSGKPMPDMDPAGQDSIQPRR
jgi:hypothetical protein